MQEGFNTRSTNSRRVSINARARVGFIANNENDCVTPDSYVGIGTKFVAFTNSAGNLAYYSPDNGNINTRTIAYIMVR